MINNIKKTLIAIGFTQLESSIYLYLLQEGPNTGYAVAKGVDKAVANVYKAIDSLAQKGGIDQTSGNNKQCRAVPWQQLIANETKKFNANIETLKTSLEQLPERQDDEQVYQIKNADQVKNHSIRMVENAQHTILASLEPDILTWLQNPLIEAAKRGVEVRVKLYEKADLPGVNIVLRQNGNQVYGKTSDIKLGLCTDGTEMLKAMLSLDTNNVVQAFHSKSALMTLVLYEQLLYELVLTELKEVIPSGDIQTAQKILTETAHLHVFSTENSVFDAFKNRYEPNKD